MALFYALIAILLWSFLAYFGSTMSRLPPLLVVGAALIVGGMIGIPNRRAWRIPLRTMLVGVGGIFGYHFLYFAAFRLAPAIETNLINYLWPLLIVLLAPVFIPGKHLSFHHIAGAGLGLCGAMLILGGGRLQLDLDNLPGYLLAAGAAATWACYSLLTHRLPPFPTRSVSAFCLVSGILSLSLHALSRPSFRLETLLPGDWLALFIAGAGPMGAAFYAWDAAMKRGDPRIIGSLSYLTPLFSTINLVILGGRTLTWVSGLAMLLIIGGALVGSLDIWRPKA